MFAMGQTPSQQLEPLLKWAADEGLKKWYILAPDYNYGQISATWVQALAKEYGAQIVGGPTFFDLAASDYTSEITKIQASGADTIVSMFVSAAQLNFYKQWAAAGLNKTTTVVSPPFGLAAEQVALGADAKGIMTAYPYFKGVKSTAADAFEKAWADAGRTDPVTPGAVDTWNGWHLWADAVNKAGTLDRDKVIAALESGSSFDSPSGTVRIDPGSHHLVVPMNLWRADGAGSFELVSELTDKALPTFENEKCDVVKNPSLNQQFVP